MEVHAELGPGFLENVYHEALLLELNARGIPHEREVAVPVLYKGTRLVCGYRADLICNGSIVVELKALSDMSGTEEAQLLNYLKATGFKRGLLLDFGAERLQVKRMVRDY